MNKLIASVGVIALGASALQAVETGALNAQQTKKAWSVSASLRGFYDDNFNSQPSATKESSTGAEIGAGLDYGFAGDVTSFNLGYDFTGRYFDKELRAGTGDHTDFTHTLGVDLTHAVTERLRFNASENFVVGQEPDLLAQGSTIANPQRVSGNNYRNNANVGASFQATSRLGLGAFYNNSITDYEDQSPFGNSARLDRMDQVVAFQPSWVLSQQTVLIGRVQYGMTEFSRENELIEPGFGILAQDRDSRSLVLSTGFKHEFSETASGSIEVGAQRTEYPNNPTKKTVWSPWVEGSLNYQIHTQTEITAGVSYNRAPSDVVAAISNTDFVTDTEAASIYTVLNHGFTEHLRGTASARYQTVKFDGGTTDGQSDNFLMLGLGLNYEFTPNLEGNAGYYFDQLTSDQVARGFERNKVYVGVTAKY